MKRKLNPAEAIANALGCDIEDVKDMRYHYGHTTRPIYTMGSWYLCATTVDNQKTAQYNDDRRGSKWVWEKCPDVFPNGRNGWIVWKSKMTEDMQP